MSDWTTVAVAGRVIERLLVIFFAGLSIYLGYRLFLKVPDFRNAQGEVKLPSMNLSVTLTRVGPGVFFGAFGVAVLLASFVNGITVESPRPREGTSATTPPPVEPARFSGAISTYDDQEIALHRAIVGETIAKLNGLQSALSTQHLSTGGHDTAIREGKLVLMDFVWSPQWGDQATFKLAVAGTHASGKNGLPPETQVALDFFNRVESTR